MYEMPQIRFDGSETPGIMEIPDRNPESKSRIRMDSSKNALCAGHSSP